jgi:hypothetical protein
MLEYKVISYRGDAILEKWLNEMAKEWYSADQIVADNWKYAVVYSRWVLKEEEQNAIENAVEEITGTSEEE